MDSPDKETGPKKEAILARSPFTKAFLDKEAMFGKEQSSALSRYHAEIMEELGNKFGKEWQRLGIAPLAVIAQYTSPFNQTIPSGAYFQTIRSLVEMGYEMGGVQDCEDLLVDIVCQLRDIGVLDKSALGSPEANIRTSTYVLGLLTTGVYYKNTQPSASPTSPPNKPGDTPSGESDPIPQVFADFLKTILPPKPQA